MRERSSMRKQENEVKDQTIIDSIIRNADVCRLAMCSDDEPYIVPMCFGRDGDSIYFHCAKEGKKMDMIRKNNKVCFELEGGANIARASIPCKWSIDYISVIGFGIASIVDDALEKRRALSTIMDHYGGKGPYEYSENALDNAAIIKVEIRNVSCKKSN
jgi:nitroimidazol reductase NimA-like FMN-containing flavoprotein (pyridoxamine 5'-phosphate oxidase superfamily)